MSTLLNKELDKKINVKLSKREALVLKWFINENTEPFNGEYSNELASIALKCEKALNINN